MDRTSSATVAADDADAGRSRTGAGGHQQSSPLRRRRRRKKPAGGGTTVISRRRRLSKPTAGVAALSPVAAAHCLTPSRFVESRSPVSAHRPHGPHPSRTLGSSLLQSSNSKGVKDLKLLPFLSSIQMAGTLIYRATLEAENPLEASLRESFNLHEPHLRPPFSLRTFTPDQYSSLNDAILFGLLREPHFAKTHIKHLHAITTDGYCYFTSMITRIVDELYGKFIDSAKIQLIWLTNEMINVLAVGFDRLLVALLRQIVGGDFSEGNLWLCSEMVSVFLNKWDCILEEEPLILTYGLYVFLRVLADHSRLCSDPRLDVLKRLEIEFSIRVLREQFALCLKIGRDLIRLLQDLVHIAEFKSIWKDLLNPGQFKVDGFEGVSQIYCLRTPSLYFSLRIMPEMERKLRYLVMNVKYICSMRHPSGEVIEPEAIPRWAVIGWLLKCCRKSYIEANLKLALFYDWLFFDEKEDSVMSIEPAILLMVNSIPKYVDVTNTLLEFLLILVDNYDVDRKDLIINGVVNSIRVLVSKGVIGSLDVLTNCDLLSPLLREMLGKLLLLTQTTHSEDLQCTCLPDNI
nr:integrator complex subunit 3 isoform X1 [Ipomoea batatas]